MLSSSVAVLIAGLLAFARGAEEFPFEKTGTFQKTFSIGPSERAEITVDNVQGSIEVVGYDGSSIELVVHESFRARSPERLEKAQDEVRLQASQEGNRVRLYVEGPFRSADGSLDYRGKRQYGYEVDFDFALRVPRRVDLVLKTVNDGEIRVDGVSGAFDVENVNGSISMTGASGSGRAYALNGEVSVVFARNPDSDSYFGSLNGDVSVVFRPELSAKVLVKTFNGEVYTDYPVSYLKELPPLVVERRLGKRVYKSSGFYGLQVGGDGGPAIKFDAFNGDIRILKRALSGEGR